MSSEKPIWSAPAWMKSGGCFMGLFPLPFAICVTALVNPWAAFSLPFALILFQSCLFTLVNGRSPESLFRIIVDLYRGRASCSTHQSETKSPDAEYHESA